MYETAKELTEFFALPLLKNFVKMSTKNFSYEITAGLTMHCTAVWKSTLNTRDLSKIFREINFCSKNVNSKEKYWLFRKSGDRVLRKLLFHSRSVEINYILLQSNAKSDHAQ